MTTLKQVLSWPLFPAVVCGLALALLAIAVIVCAWELRQAQKDVEDDQ